jgi:hypothetical protein
LNVSAVTLARENELSRSQIDAYGACPACGFPKDATTVTCGLCLKKLKGNSKRRRQRVKGNLTNVGVRK